VSTATVQQLPVPIPDFPGRVDVEVVVPVVAEPPVAFAAMTQWNEQGRWMLGSKVWVSRGSGREPGDELTAWTGLGRVGFVDTMTVTAATDAMVVVEHTGRVVRGYGWMGIDPSDGRTRFVWGEAVRPPLGVLGRVGWVVVGPALRLAVRYSLRTLARLVETGELPR
jgi:hypothetical protein